jgi:hypothetical protein
VRQLASQKSSKVLETYRRCGGVRGAIAQTAERVFTAFEPDAQTVARNVFLRLTALGDTTEDTRRRVTRAELLDGTDRDAVPVVLDELAAARLIVLVRRPSRSPTRH